MSKRSKKQSQHLAINSTVVHLASKHRVAVQLNHYSMESELISCMAGSSCSTWKGNKHLKNQSSVLTGLKPEVVEMILMKVLFK